MTQSLRFLAYVNDKYDDSRDDMMTYFRDQLAGEVSRVEWCRDNDFSLGKVRGLIILRVK